MISLKQGDNADWRLAHSKARTVGQRVTRARVRIAITATFCVAALAVAIVAGAKNPTPESASDVVSSTPSPIVDRTTTASAPTEGEVRVVEPEENFLTSETLVVALDDYDRAARARAHGQSDDSQTGLRKATKALWDSSGRFLNSDAGHADESNRRRILADVRQYMAAGVRLVEAADEQRAAPHEYSTRWADMRARVREAIDGSWKLFGRVIVRPYLITLNHEIEELGRHAANLPGAHDNDLDAISASLATSEAAVAATLVDNERGLVSSQGSEWLQQMRTDLSLLAASRVKLREMDAHRAALTDQFERLRTRLGTPTLRVAVATTPATVALPPPVENSAPPVAPQAPQSQRPSAIIAPVSAGILLLFVLISVAIARSVAGRTGRQSVSGTHLPAMDATAPAGPTFDRPTETLEGASPKPDLEQRLRGALKRGEFELVFHPELNLDTLEVELVEVLMRWRQPGGRLTGLDDYLAVAEGSGVIVDIGDWALRSAIDIASVWHHGNWPRARVAVRVSAPQLTDPGFVERVNALLNEHRLPPRCIEIELTEVVLRSGPAALEALRQLRACGIAVSLGDYGTGYSSLASLLELPLTQIKLDRSLADKIDTSQRVPEIAQGITGLAQKLRLQLADEGVARAEELGLLLRDGGVCVLRHFACCDQPDEHAPANRPAPVGSPEQLSVFYGSRIAFRTSFFWAPNVYRAPIRSLAVDDVTDLPTATREVDSLPVPAEDLYPFHPQMPRTRKLP